MRRMNVVHLTMAGTRKELMVMLKYDATFSLFLRHGFCLHLLPSMMDLDLIPRRSGGQSPRINGFPRCLLYLEMHYIWG